MTLLFRLAQIADVDIVETHILPRFLIHIDRHRLPKIFKTSLHSLNTLKLNGNVFFVNSISID